MVMNYHSLRLYTKIAKRRRSLNYATGQFKLQGYYSIRSNRGESMTDGFVYGAKAHLMKAVMFGQKIFRRLMMSLYTPRSVAESWCLSRQLYLWYQAMFVAEHLLLCIPIIKLRFNIASRNADLAEAGLQLMAEERQSMQTVNWLVAVGLLGAVLLPLLQMLLAALYFKVGSPWSTVLNAKVNVFAWNAERGKTRKHSKLWNILFWVKDQEEEEEAEEVAHNGGADVEQNLAWLRRNSKDMHNLPMVRRGKSVDFDEQ